MIQTQVCVVEEVETSNFSLAVKLFKHILTRPTLSFQ